MSVKPTILSNIKAVHKASGGCNLDLAIFSELKYELDQLSSFLETTNIQSFFFAIIFAETLSQKSLDRADLVRHLGCEYLDYLEYEQELQLLFEKGFLTNVRSGRRGMDGLIHQEFALNNYIHSAIVSNKKLSPATDIKLHDSSSLVEFIHAEVVRVKEDDLNFDDILNILSVIIKKHRSLGLMKSLAKYKLEVEDICILFYFIGAFRLGDKYECIKRLSIDLYGEKSKASKLMQSMVYEKHVLVKESLLQHYGSRTNDEFDFELSGVTKQLLRKHSLLPEFNIKICDDTFELLYSVEEFFKKRDDEFITAAEFLGNVEKLINLNSELAIIKELKSVKLKNARNEMIYLKCLYDGGIGEETDLEDLAKAVYSNERQAALMKNELIQETSEFTKKGLLEVVEGTFFSNAQLRLTDMSLQLLVDCGMEIPEKKKNNYSILPADIKAKELFYNEEDAKQMMMLHGVLQEKQFANIQKRMSEKALPTGVVALLYGVPGTGKTESVYQMAKQTGREVIQVDISKSKSMWFGQSEKQIKKIFTQYENYAKRCKLKPILLFNEADAIISQRRSMASTNVSQTENRMQNILLEELEKFSGICIATTNLINNIDTAFERRFLYKIQLHKPCTDTMMKIWRSKLSDPDTYDVVRLANKYAFSGGQIDNIIKKIEMHEILHGKKPATNEVIDWCDTELFDRNNIRRIGFITKA
ncbi:MAG: hypothetical protein C0593_02695 [Marinilabiliales bacterium]|nr:MAG: hypothetical protein C0593_02695 [Marinilabiliales bacterium]